MPSSPDVSDPAYVRARAMVTLFERLEHLCEGAIAIDRGGRVIYVNEKYLASLGLKHTTEAIGRPIEEIIPNSLMRTVAESGEPILLDIMELGGEQLVVTRMPIEDEKGNIIGAIGFVLYDRLEGLKPLLGRVAQLENDLRLARRQLSHARAARFTFDDYVGATADIAQAKTLAARAARQSVTILLTGETGTGKEMMAQAIHNASARAEKPFVSVNVAAIPDTLIESEFFGAAPGAYTGADRKGRDGKFRIADGGTLFLDEIGEMPLQLQAKLLRVLQEREIEPLGSDKISRIDVRVVAATNVDLRRRVSDGTFRPDLYYRLNVLSIDLPPLRKCLADLPDICTRLIEDISASGDFVNVKITPSGLSALARYDWPGNVRELQNVIERAAILSQNGRLRIDLPDTSGALVPTGAARQKADARPAVMTSSEMRDHERANILAALEACAGKVFGPGGAAEMLDIKPTTLASRIKALGIAPRPQVAHPSRRPL